MTKVKMRKSIEADVRTVETKGKRNRERQLAVAVTCFPCCGWQVFYITLWVKANHISPLPLHLYIGLWMNSIKASRSWSLFMHTKGRVNFPFQVLHIQPQSHSELSYFREKWRQGLSEENKCSLLSLVVQFVFFSVFAVCWFFYICCLPTTNVVLIVFAYLQPTIHTKSTLSWGGTALFLLYKIHFFHTRQTTDEKPISHAIK